MKLKQAVLSAVALASLGVSLVMTGTASAAVTCPDGTIHAHQSKPTYAECNIDSSATTDDLLGTVKNVINVVLGILGVVAVVVIILGGFSFITSQGDAGKVMKGRNTIIWGVVGLIVSLSAFVIVNLVIGAITNTNSNSGPGHTVVTDPNTNPGHTITPDDNSGAGHTITPDNGNSGPGHTITQD